MKDLKAIQRTGLFCLMAAVGVFVSGCGGGKHVFVDPPPHAWVHGSGNGDATEGVADPLDVGIKFQVNDTIQVKLSGSSFESTHEEKVKDDGTITLRYIGPIVALHRTAGQLQKEIHDKYVPKWYPMLNVVVSSPDQVYYVGGEVRVNNRQPYIGGLTLLRAIQSAGGFTDFADQRRVVVTRSNGAKLTVDCVRARGDSGLDIKIYPGDTIHVPRSIW